MSFREKLSGDAAGGGDAGKKGRYVRHLGAVERLLRLMSIDRPRDFCVAAEIVTDVAWGNFKAALDQVQRRHSLLQVEIRDERESGMAYYRVERPIALEFRPLSSNDDWRSVVEEELTRPIDGLSGPLMRATVLLQAQKAQIVLIFHHSIADGVAAAVVIRDLMVALGGKELCPLAVPDSLEEAHARLAPERQDKVGDGSPVPVPPSPPQTLWRDFESDRAVVSMLEMGESLTTDIRSSARENGTTVHGAICAALALSGRGEGGPEDYGIMTPINVRETLKLRADQFGLYQAMGTTRMSVPSGTPFWDIARQVTSALVYPRSETGVSNSIQAMSASLPVNASKSVANGVLGSLHYDAIVSNLGLLPIPETVGRIRLTSFWGPMFPGRFRGQRVIGAVTVGGRLRLVETRPDHLPSALEKMQQKLRDAVGPSLH